MSVSRCIPVWQGSEIKDRLRAMDVNALSPVDAWKALEELKKLAEGKRESS
jgi:hypothetical protein